MGFSLLCFPHNFSPFLPSFSFLRISSSSFSLLLLSTYDRGPRGCRAGGVSWSQLSHRWGPPAGTVPPRQAPAQLRPVVRQSSAPEMPHKFPPFPSPPPLPPIDFLTTSVLRNSLKRESYCDFMIMGVFLIFSLCLNSSPWLDRQIIFLYVLRDI